MMNGKYPSRIFFLMTGFVLMAAPLSLAIQDKSGIQVEWPGDVRGTDGAGHDGGFGDDFDGDWEDWEEPYPPERDPFGDGPRPGHIPPVIGGEEGEDGGDKPEPDKPKPGGSGGGSGGSGGGWGEDTIGGLPLMDSKENLSEKEKEMRKLEAAKELFSPGHTVGGREPLPPIEPPAPQDEGLPEEERVADGLQPINVIA